MNILSSSKEEAAFFQIRSSRLERSFRNFINVIFYFSFFFLHISCSTLRLSHLRRKKGKGCITRVLTPSILTIRMKKLGGSWRKVVLVPQERLDRGADEFRRMDPTRGGLTSIRDTACLSEGVYLFFPPPPPLPPLDSSSTPFSRYIMFSRKPVRSFERRGSGSAQRPTLTPLLPPRLLLLERIF